MKILRLSLIAFVVSLAAILGYSVGSLFLIWIGIDLSVCRPLIGAYLGAMVAVMICIDDIKGKAG